MIVYRLSKSIYANDLSGYGARIAGGRWNSKGLPLIYTSSSLALCTVEVAVHVPLGNLPRDFSIISLSIADNISIESVDQKKLLANWNSFPYIRQTQQIGDDFIQEGKTAVLKVPSAVVQGDFNFLINPLHPDVKKVKIKSVEPYEWDGRLFKR